jgi:hypothetical protein
MDMAAVMLWKSKNGKTEISGFSGFPTGPPEAGKRKGKNPSPIGGFPFPFSEGVIP